MLLALSLTGNGTSSLHPPKVDYLFHPLWSQAEVAPRLESKLSSVFVLITCPPLGQELRRNSF